MGEMRIGQRGCDPEEALAPRADAEHGANAADGWDGPVDYTVRALTGLGDPRPARSRWINAQKSRLMRLHARIS
jgi:hypothetical protein